MQQKIRVSVLMGGPSAEYDVSLNSGKNVLKFLDKQKYAAKKVIVSRQGKWPMSFKTLKQKFDVVFIAMHGEYGEDGTVQALLDKNKITYTGSGAAASRLGIDKIASGKKFTAAGLRLPGIPKGFPMVVKPADRGSSVGVTIVPSPKELPAALKLARRFSKRVMIQEYIGGREMTCGVLDVGGRMIALPPTEIIPKASTFFDYKAKYAKGGSLEITPARAPKPLTKKMQAAALKAHKAIGGRGYSRTDFRIDGKGRIFILEINTLPGMTATSLLPQAAAAAGISFAKLLDYIIEAALKNRS